MDVCFCSGSFYRSFVDTGVCERKAHRNPMNSQGWGPWMSPNRVDFWCLVKNMAPNIMMGVYFAETWGKQLVGGEALHELWVTLGYPIELPGRTSPILGV